MTRLIKKRAEELTPEERAQFDRIGKFHKPGPDGTHGGPFDPWIRSPELAKRAVSFGNFIWERTTLDRRLIEMAILVTARFWESNYEWVSHTRIALEYGISQPVIDDVFQGKRPEQAPEDEQVVYDVCMALHQTHRLPQELYQKVVELFGERGLVEMIAAISQYTLVSMTLNAFDVGLEEGMKAPFPL
jgi:4-carboxymuconolactone decarboxylase